MKAKQNKKLSTMDNPSLTFNRKKNIFSPTIRTRNHAARSTHSERTFKLCSKNEICGEHLSTLAYRYSDTLSNRAISHCRCLRLSSTLSEVVSFRISSKTKPSFRIISDLKRKTSICYSKLKLCGSNDFLRDYFPVTRC